MRDRLIELLKKKYDHFCDQCGVNKDSHYIENLADHLLANGVIVPPCKVGDIVYCVGKKEIIECVVREFSLTSKGLDSLIISQKYISPKCTFIHSKKLENLHKIKFTKEEAEKALKGGAKE